MSLPLHRLFEKYRRKINIKSGDDEIYKQINENLSKSKEDRSKFHEGYVYYYGGTDPDNKITNDFNKVESLIDNYSNIIKTINLDEGTNSQLDLLEQNISGSLIDLKGSIITILEEINKGNRSANRSLILTIIATVISIICLIIALTSCGV